MDSEPAISDDFFVSHAAKLSPSDVNTHISVDNSFSVLHINVQSLQNKIGQLEYFLSEIDLHFSCIVISETWFNRDSFLGEFAIDGYNLFSSSRLHGYGGGVAVYVNDMFEARMETARLEGSESLLVRVGLAGWEVSALLAVYRSPSGVLPVFLRDLAECLSSLPSTSLVVGDFNIDLNVENHLDTFSLNYCDVLNKYGFFNTIHSPTRYGRTKISLLDHILVNNCRKFYNTCTVDLEIADHLPICMSFKISKESQKQDTSIKFSKLNYAQLKDNLDETDWSSVLTCSDTNLAFENFISIFQQKIATSSKVVSVKKQKSKRKSFQQPWMTEELRLLTKKRKDFHDRCKISPFDTALQENYRNFRNFVSCQINEAKKAYFKQEFSQCKHDQFKRWKFIKKMLNGPRKNENSDILTIKKKDDPTTLCESSKEVVETFNDFFVNVGTALADNLPAPQSHFSEYFYRNSNQTQFNFYPIDSHDVLPIVNSLQTKKATGHDKIPSRAIKENKCILVPILVFLINLIIENSVFPDCLKIARVTPVFKKGDKQNCNNYRPISILSAISKIVEKILSYQIIDFLETNSILTASQFGFRKGKNTTGAINELMEQLYDNFNHGETTVGVFLDFSKAFDTINHKILVSKLKFNGFQPAAANLIENYLQNRQQFVFANNCMSEMRSISIGVPQGSNLGPLLFLIYINDLLNSAPNLNYILYADDTNIFTTDPETLNKEILSVEKWCLANKLVLNYSKTFQLIFNSPQKKRHSELTTVKLSTRTLEIKNETKFLGIVLDSHISFRSHINELCRKLNLVVLMMRAVRPYFDNKTMIDLYYSFFYPHLLYGIEFWGHAAATDLKRIAVIQKASLRVILKKKPREHVSSFFKTAKIMPVKLLFEFCSLKLFLKTFSAEFIKTLHFDHDYNTRFSGLRTKKVNNKRGERSLLCHGVNLYNRYQLDAVTFTQAGPWDGLAARLWAGV